MKVKWGRECMKYLLRFPRTTVGEEGFIFGSSWCIKRAAVGDSRNLGIIGEDGEMVVASY